MEEHLTSPTQPPSSEPLTKKRPRENDAVSLNFKLRVILRDIRPHFIEVLQTADFRNCKAADEIRHQMEILVELFGQKTNRTSATEILREGVVDKAKDTSIIGGSVFGWNFVTLAGKDPVYCGVTKETFRANNTIPSQSE